jgi:hypothetical protein
MCARCRAQQAHCYKMASGFDRDERDGRCDGNDGGTKSGRLVTNDGHQRRNNRPHAGDKLWDFHKNSAYGVSQ